MLSSMRRSDYIKIFLFTVLLIAVGGYRFGTGDHVSQLPSALHFLDPELYQTDFPNQLIFPPYLKVGIHVVLFSLAYKIGMPVEYLYLACFFVVAYMLLLACWRILMLLGVRQGSAELAMALFVLFSLLYPSVSHFQIVVKRLVPYFFVLPLCLYSIWFFLQGRYLAASLLASCSFIAHQQLGLILFAGMSFSLLYSMFIPVNPRHEDGLSMCHVSGRLLERAGRLYLQAGSPSVRLISWFMPFASTFLAYFVINLLMGSHRGYPWFDPAWGRELLAMVKFRVPHHLLISYAKIKHVAGFLVSIGLTCYIAFFQMRDSRPVQMLAFMAIGLSLLVPVGILFTSYYPLPVALSLYLFRGDIFIRIIFFCVLVAFLDRKLHFNISSRQRNILYGAAAVVSMVLVFIIGRIQVHIPGTEVPMLCQCIQEKTGEDAFILAPPDIQGIRLYSRRSVFASWKSHGLFFMPGIAREWFHRMKLLCGGDDVYSCMGKGCRKMCGKNYDHLSVNDLLDIARSYNVDYLLLRNRTEPVYKPVCKSENFVLYHLDSVGASAGNHRSPARYLQIEGHSSGDIEE